uniref:Ribosomal RNA-processing protein 40 n=1 Tax=Phallusia mammillata TaxID=59560 RepID=A0A6F9DD10_9ASCI|nr:exosome complex component RRP40-like [Phallusia mammillata]
MLLNNVGEHIYLPGDVINSKIQTVCDGETVRLGPGLSKHNTDVTVSKAGSLCFGPPNTFWIDCHQKRYIPCKGENVIGVISGKQGDYYKVDIGSSDQALLNFLSFEGASKRNRPNLSPGDVVFGKLAIANKHMEPEMTCVDVNGKANGMGLVDDKYGILFQTSLNLARKLLSPDCILLPELGSRLAFEVIVGLNGKIALFCKSSAQTITLMKLINESEYLSNEQMLDVLKGMFL